MAPTRRRGRREARAPGRPLPSPRRPSAVMAVAAAGAGAPRASSRPRGRGAVAGVRGGAGGGSPHSPLSPAVHVSRAGGGVRPAGPWFSAWRLTADLELVQTRGIWSRGPAAAQAGPGAGPATSRHGARRPPARLAGTGRRRPAAAQAASVPATPHSRSLGGAVDSAMGGRATQSAAAAQAASVPATPHSRSLGGAVDSAMGGRATQSAAAAQADTGCGRDTQAGPGMGSARDRPLAGDPQRCATTGSGPIWGR
ncbi:uncharacterized protein LOC143270323 [Peromyscus maniculatus bairdii]|uniref:uncharacterized protein LOC143270323 n=1 Tax=Peromyscus maniculatus bairdii TaxID=230844 RepID=UPI003FD0825F